MSSIHRHVFARQHRQAGFPRHAARRQLVAGQRDRLGARADKDQPGIFHRAGKFLILGQEPVAGMDGLRAGFARRVDHRFNIQVAQRGLGWPHVDALVRVADGQRVAVGV